MSYMQERRSAVQSELAKNSWRQVVNVTKRKMAK